MEPGPGLHSGMFRERTIQEVIRVREIFQKSSSFMLAPVILEALDKLENYCVDCVVLQRTSIGKEVKKLEKHADPMVAERAEALHSQWKRDFHIREQVIEGFSVKGTLRKRDARELEEGLFNSACPLGLLEGDGYRSYIRHYKRLCTHLKTRGLGSLVQRFQDKEISFREAAALSDSELLSIEKKQQQEAAQKEGLRAAMLTQQLGNTLTNEYVCSKCESAHCAYVELQTGWHNDQQDTTILVNCLDCGERWKANDDHGLAGS